MQHWAEISGREFDWFAFDSEGNVALFSTGGEGPIPECVMHASEEHDSVADALHEPNWGSPAVWSDYSKIGFFVFDWDRTQEVYAAKGVPVTSLDSGLRERIGNISELPRYVGRFSSPTDLMAPASWAQV